MKFCSKCKRYLPVGKFHVRKISTSVRSWCKDCVNSDNLDRYHKSDKRRVRKISYRYNLKVNYGLSEEQYNSKYLEQNGQCSLCGIELENKFLDIFGARGAVDHDHKTGKTREILCMKCNTGLGSFNDDVNSLKRAVIYLEKYCS